jgi:NAD(P)-dependent dehydrogenase (short-subunit alcohol dehydrogenase family)
MKKRYVLITGSAGGIGRATVDYFAEKNWFVIGVDRAPLSGEFPKDGRFIQADIAVEEDWENIKEVVSEVTDSLDAVVNNAAIQITKPVVETTVEEWDLVLDTNLRSAFLSVRTLFPFLSASGGGAVVNVSSVHAVATSKEIAAYAASKGGMLALTRALAIELAKDNIRVNTVLPGAVDTEMLRAGLNRDHAGGGSPDERLENLARKTVSGKIGKPEEIARAIYFLADQDQSSFITGQPLVIDGGATSRLSTE